MDTVFFKIFFISDKQLFFVMQFLNAMTSEITTAHFFQKSQVVKLEMFFY